MKMQIPHDFLLERRHRADDDEGLVVGRPLSCGENGRGGVIVAAFDLEDQIRHRAKLVRQRLLGELLRRAADAVVRIAETFEPRTATAWRSSNA